MAVNRIGQMTHVLLRIVTGFLFLQHGGQKLLGWFGGMGGPGGGGPLPPLMMVAGTLELVGGTLILIGFLTRPVAFILAGEMAAAYFTAHFPNGPLPIRNHGESAVLFCFIFLFLFGNGSGGFSLDALMRRTREIPLTTTVRGAA